MKTQTIILQNEMKIIYSLAKFLYYTNIFIDNANSLN